MFKRLPLWVLTFALAARANWIDQVISIIDPRINGCPILSEKYCVSVETNGCKTKADGCSVPALFDGPMDALVGRPYESEAKSYFHSACVAHDLCYEWGSKTYGFSRLYCDQRFFSDMVDLCRDPAKIARFLLTSPTPDFLAACPGMARAYYDGVKALSEDHFITDQSCPYLGGTIDQMPFYIVKPKQQGLELKKISARCMDINPDSMKIGPAGAMFELKQVTLTKDGPVTYSVQLKNRGLTAYLLEVLRVNRIHEYCHIDYLGKPVQHFYGSEKGGSISNLPIRDDKKYGAAIGLYPRSIHTEFLRILGKYRDTPDTADYLVSDGDASHVYTWYDKMETYEEFEVYLDMMISFGVHYSVQIKDADDSYYFYASGIKDTAVAETGYRARNRITKSAKLPWNAQGRRLNLLQAKAAGSRFYKPE